MDGRVGCGKNDALGCGKNDALLRLTHPTLDVLDGYGSCLGIEVGLDLGLEWDFEMVRVGGWGCILWGGFFGGLDEIFCGFGFGGVAGVFGGGGRGRLARTIGG